jgi:ABC-type glycerol-3-phosphate transport system permease component
MKRSTQQLRRSFTYLPLIALALLTLLPLVWMICAAFKTN